MSKTLITLVADICDSFDLAVLDEFRDTKSEVIWVDLVRKFSDDETGALIDLFDFDDSAHDDRATACSVRLFNSLPTDYETFSWEVWSFDDLEDRFEGFRGRCFRIL